jgi:outer membrane murein-binding lipoprotein Lpp
MIRFTIAAALAGTLSFSLAGCSSQAMAYKENPICREAQQKCKVYYETMDRTKTDRGAGIDLLREDCEASQRACADGVSRSLETSHPGEPGARKSLY